MLQTTNGFDIARRQIEFARDYSLSLIADVADGDWFRQPSGCVTHVAWQVGHLAVCEYLLTLFRLRGKLAEDEELIPKSFLRQFNKRSTPDPDPAANPSPGEIRDVLQRVHGQALHEMSEFPEAELAASVIEPYAVCNNKLGSLLFCAMHEMLHAGQIGLMRRLLGKPPLR